MHQCFFSPPIASIIEAASNDQLSGIPFLSKPDVVRKYLAPSPATSKGRMKKQRANVRSTRANRRSSEQPTVTMELGPDAFQEAQQRPVEAEAPVISQNECNVFCCAALGDARIGTFYTDMTGAFPTMSLAGMQYYFTAYDYDTNNIFACSANKGTER